MSNNHLSPLLRKNSTRRDALKKMGVGAAGLAALGILPAGAQIAIDGTETTSPFPKFTINSGDLAILDFALNLEYLEANFYAYATTGSGIAAQGVETSGRGTLGTVTVPASTQVPFSDPNLLEYAAEITKDEIAHVKFLRGICLAGGHQPVAQPAIDLVNSFNGAAAAAGLGTLNPFSDDLSFLLGAFIFEDVGVTAYHGALASIVNRAMQSGAAGIMGTEAYHASNIRAQLYERGSAAQTDALAIANAINTLGGTGIAQGVTSNNGSNIVPTDSNALVFTRTTQQVLDIVYLSPSGTPGGFFPNGINA